MKTIWKYSLTLGLNMVDLPRGAKVVSVGVQNGDIQMWAICTPDEIFERRQFEVVGTGWTLAGTNWDYIGMVQIGAFVWHVLETSTK